MNQLVTEVIVEQPRSVKNISKVPINNLIGVVKGEATLQLS